MGRPLGFQVVVCVCLYKFPLFNYQFFKILFIPLKVRCERMMGWDLSGLILSEFFSAIKKIYLFYNIHKYFDIYGETCA